MHSPVNGSDNEFLIFGNLPVASPSSGLAPELANFLGRWEGVDNSPPVRGDYKAVLAIQEIDDREGKAYLWYGTILQYPSMVREIYFRVVPGTENSLEANITLGPGEDGRSYPGTIKLLFDQKDNVLKGGILSRDNPTNALPVTFRRTSSFYVYRDYEAYFASLRIYAKPYQNPDLQKDGWGYLVYLPERYENQADQNWPLIFFLCGTGERGTNPLLLAKHGPWNYIREKGPLPFVIIAPMLNETDAYRSFPEAYLSGALDEILANYRIDPKRVYLTGLSMGGEASYRFALYRPEAFAAVAPFAAFDAKFMPASYRDGFKPSTLPYERLKNMPFWVFHGTEDTFVPFSVAQQTVNALIQAGADVRFNILQGADHNSWSDAYLDPAFYHWLLEHHP